MSRDQYPDRILMTGMSFYGRTGYFSFEKENGQIFCVDLTLYFRDLKAVRTDELKDTVDYGAVFETVRALVEDNCFDLIEKLAGEIIHSVLAKYPVDAAEILLRKPQAPIEGKFDSMAVSLYREREFPEGRK